MASNAFKYVWVTCLVGLIVMIVRWEMPESRASEHYAKGGIVAKQAQFDKHLRERTQGGIDARRASTGMPQRWQVPPRNVQPFHPQEVKPNPTEAQVPTTQGQALIPHVLSIKPFRIDIRDEKYPTIADATGQLEGDLEGEPGLHWKVVRQATPRVFRLFNTLSDADCEAIVQAAKDRIQRSSVVAGPGGSGAISQVRTSHGMFLDRGLENMQANINLRRRVAAMLGVPVVNVEATQVLRYLPGQFYRAHPDYFSRAYPEHLARGGQRMATALTWLNDVPEGGETGFPSVNVQLKPMKGGSVLFYSMTTDGTEDPHSMHEGIPPKEPHIKWVAVSWVRQHEFH